MRWAYSTEVPYNALSVSSSSGKTAELPTATMNGSAKSPYFLPFFLTALRTRSESSATHTEGWKPIVLLVGSLRPPGLRGIASKLRR